MLEKQLRNEIVEMVGFQMGTGEWGAVLVVQTTPGNTRRGVFRCAYLEDLIHRKYPEVNCVAYYGVGGIAANRIPFVELALTTGKHHEVVYLRNTQALEDLIKAGNPLWGAYYIQHVTHQDVVEALEPGLDLTWDNQPLNIAESKQQAVGLTKNTAITVYYSTESGTTYYRLVYAGDKALSRFYREVVYPLSVTEPRALVQDDSANVKLDHTLQVLLSHWSPHFRIEPIPETNRVCYPQGWSKLETIDYLLKQRFPEKRYTARVEFDASGHTGCLHVVGVECDRLYGVTIDQEAYTAHLHSVLCIADAFNHTQRMESSQLQYLRTVLGDLLNIDCWGALVRLDGAGDGALVPADQLDPRAYAKLALGIDKYVRDRTTVDQSLTEDRVQITVREYMGGWAIHCRGMCQGEANLDVVFQVEGPKRILGPYTITRLPVAELRSRAEPAYLFSSKAIREAIGGEVEEWHYAAIIEWGLNHDWKTVTRYGKQLLFVADVSLN